MSLIDFVKVVPQSPAQPSARDGMAAVIVGQALLIFGGVADAVADDDAGDDDDDDDDVNADIVKDSVDEDEDEEAESGLKECNDLWLFDFASSTWATVSVSGAGPTPRTGSVMFRHANDANVVFLFGGFSSTSGWFSDLFRLDLAARRWERIDDDAGDVPTCRDKIACATAPDGRVWLFGGFGPLVDEAGDDGFGDGSTFSWFEDLYVFDTLTARFSRVATAGSAPRCAAGAAVVGGELLVFGGSSSRDPTKRSDELRALPLPAAGATGAVPAWRVIAAPHAPAGRSFVSAVQLAGRFVVLFGKSRQDLPLGDGGVFFNDSWTPVAAAAAGAGPAARQYAQLVARDATHALLFGGSGNAVGVEVRFNDLFVVRLRID